MIPRLHSRYQLHQWNTQNSTWNPSCRHACGCPIDKNTCIEGSVRVRHFLLSFNYHSTYQCHALSCRKIYFFYKGAVPIYLTGSTPNGKLFKHSIRMVCSSCCGIKVSSRGERWPRQVGWSPSTKQEPIWHPNPQKEKVEKIHFLSHFLFLTSSKYKLETASSMLPLDKSAFPFSKASSVDKRIMMSSFESIDNANPTKSHRRSLVW